MRYSPNGPLLPFSLLVVWLLLTQDLSFANVALGLLAASLITVGTALLRPLRLWMGPLRAKGHCLNSWKRAATLIEHRCW